MQQPRQLLNVSVFNSKADSFLLLVESSVVQGSMQYQKLSSVLKAAVQCFEVAVTLSSHM